MVILDEFREIRPKSAVVLDNIDALRELILQSRHEAYLGISSTRIHSILHGHLAVKKKYSRWIPHNLKIAQKKLASIAAKKCKKISLRCFERRV